MEVRAGKTHLETKEGVDGMSVTNSSGESACSAIRCIESLVTRFERAERSINDDIEQIEKRLGQLIELVKDVSTVKLQAGNQQKSLNVLRQEFRRHIEALEKLIESSEGDYADSLNELNQHISSILEELQSDCRTTKYRLTIVENSLQTWLNRGIGGWTVITIVFSAAQFFGIKYINSLEEDRKKSNMVIESLERRVYKLENSLELIKKEVRSLKTQ